MVMTPEPASDRLLTASAAMAILPEMIARTSLMIMSIILQIIPTAPLTIPQRILDVWSSCLPYCGTVSFNINVVSIYLIPEIQLFANGVIYT